MSFIKKIFASFNNIHFQSLLGSGVMAVFGMLTVSILYHSLSIIDVGVYVFFMALIGLVDTIKAGFLNISFVTFYSGSEEARANEVAGSSWCLALLICGGLMLFNVLTYFISSLFSNYGLVLFLRYFSVITLSSIPLFMAMLVVQAEKRFDRLLWLRLICQFLFTGTVILLIFLKKANVISVIITYGMTNVIASCISLLLGWTKIGSIKYATKKTVSELFHFGKYSAGTNISSNLFSITDTFFINMFLGPAALAMYNLGGKLIQVVEIPLLSFVSSSMPNLSSFYNNERHDEMILNMKKMIGTLTWCIFIFAVISVVFAEPVITLLGGSKYTHSSAPNLFRIFIILAILYPTDRFFALTLDVIHKPQINFYKIIVVLAINLSCDFVGLSLYKSVYAVALPNVFPLLAAIIMAYIPLNQYYKFNIWGIYIVGYKELIILVKSFFTQFLSNKNTPAILIDGKSDKTINDTTPNTKDLK